MTDNGTVGADRQIQSPASAGSRGLAKTTQFTNNRTQMQMGNSPIAESMVEIRNILNRIDGVNVPVQEAEDGKEGFDYPQGGKYGYKAERGSGTGAMGTMQVNVTIHNRETDETMYIKDMNYLELEKGEEQETLAMIWDENKDLIQKESAVKEAPKDSDIDYAKLMLQISAMKDKIAELPIDDDRKTSALTALGQVEDDLSMDEAYEPFPEEDEMTFEDDDAFYEAFGELGFPEDENELFDAEYRGRKVPLNKPMRGDVKKFKVYVKDPKSGNVKKVNFGHGGSSARKAGQKTMKIRKSNPKARKSFRARHNCANPGPKTKARYWSCRKW